jgi:hypothetical protein
MAAAMPAETAPRIPPPTPAHRQRHGGGRVGGATAEQGRDPRHGAARRGTFNGEGHLHPVASLPGAAAARRSSPQYLRQNA